MRDNDCDDGAMKCIKKVERKWERANQEEIRPEENMCEGERIKSLGSPSCRGVGEWSREGGLGRRGKKMMGE